MAVFTGATGKLFLNDDIDVAEPGTEIAKVQNWSLNTSVSLVSTKTLGDRDDFFVPVGRSTTGSCRILYYQETLGTVNSNNSASTFLNKIIKQRETNLRDATLDQNTTDTTLGNFRIRLHVDDTSGFGKFVDMRVFITSAALSMSVGDVLAADISFQCQGAPVAVSL